MLDVRARARLHVRAPLCLPASRGEARRSLRVTAVVGAQVPVVASNRIGTETFDGSSITFYGGSFISGQGGEVLQQVGLGCVDDGETLQCRLCDE